MDLGMYCPYNPLYGWGLLRGVPEHLSASSKVPGALECPGKSGQRVRKGKKVRVEVR